MKRRILSTLLALLLCAGLATAAQADGNHDITEDGEYTITGTGETTAYTIKVADGVTATIKLDNVKIDVSNFAICAFDIGDGANVTLVLVGNNELKSGNSSNGAPGIHLPASATLTIESSTGGSLEVTGGAGSSYGGIGIGGDSGDGCGTLIINSGEVTVEGGSAQTKDGNAYGGAGIGGGAVGNYGGSGGSVTVNGGEVTATCGDGGSSSGITYGGAGIGGGAGSSKGGDGSTVVIELTNTVTATGGNQNSAHTGNDIGGGRGAIDAASDGQGIRPVTGEADTYEVYGNLTLNKDVTIPKNINVVIPEGASLTVGKGVTLAVNGTLTLTDGKLTNNGTITGSGNLTGTVFPEDSAGNGIRTLFNKGTISVKDNDFATKVVWNSHTHNETVGYGTRVTLGAPISVSGAASPSGAVGDINVYFNKSNGTKFYVTTITGVSFNTRYAPYFLVEGADWAPPDDEPTRPVQLIAEFTPDNTNNLLGSITNGPPMADDSPFRLTIRLRKPQNVALTASESPGKAKATWTPYDGVNQFSLQLYKGSSPVTNKITLGMTVYEYEFDIPEAGTYTFKVWGSSLVADEYTMVESNELTFHAVTLMNGQDKIGTYYVAHVNTLTLPTGIDNLPDGSALESWTLNGGSEIYAPGAVVTVKSDMTFTANLSTPSGGGDTPATPPVEIPDTYPITVADAANGEVSTSLTNASRGSVITITATPDTGYSVGSVSVTGPDGRVDVKRVNATTYTFVMPEGEVTVRVTFTTGLPFTDVSANQWFYEAVSYVYTNGMMEGDSATTFNPDGQMTRAIFWAVLGRIDGANITGANWVDTARNWAMSEGVSDGTDPNGLVTREMLVTMLWRYVGEPASDYSLSAYSDAASVSDWAETAMAWAVENGVISGLTATTLVPQGTATRAQCAAIFMRYDQM